LAIGPMDIHHKEFSTVRVGGYNKEEVDAFLDIVADELDRLLHRNQEQAELIESMREKASQFDSMQQTLQNALINAQKSADNIVQEARVQAEAQVKEAQDQSLRILEEAKAERSRILESYSGIREQVLRYIATIRDMLEKNQVLVKEYENRLVAAEVREGAAQAGKETLSVPSEAVFAGASGTRPEVPVAPPEQPKAAPIPEPGAAAPSIPEPAIAPSPAAEPSLEAVPESPRAPSAVPEPAPVTEAAPQPQRPPVTPEQEMEIMQNALREERESRKSAPAPKEAAPAEEKEKHFFWE